MSCMESAEGNDVYGEAVQEGNMGICGVAVLMFFQCGDAVNKSQLAVLR